MSDKMTKVKLFPRTSNTHFNLHTQSSTAPTQHQNKDDTEHSHFQMMQDASQFRGEILLCLWMSARPLIGSLDRSVRDLLAKIESRGKLSG